MIQNIQILRFVAALLVTLHHATPPIVWQIVYPEIPVLHQIAKIGFAGVDIFFVISGAIMAETTRQLQPGLRSAAGFAVKRFARVYSGWWPVFLIFLALYLGSNAYEGKNINLLKSFLLLPQPLDAQLLPIVWTLVYELYFYLLVAVLLLCQRATQLRILFLLGLAIATLTVAFAQQGIYSPDGLGRLPLLVEFTCSPFLLEFIAGFLVCDWVRRHPQQPWQLWLAASLLFCIAAYLYQSSSLMRGSGMAGYFHYPERVMLFGIPACGLLVVALCLPEPRSRPALLAARLGDASYSLYLTHLLALRGMYILMPLVPGLLGLWRHVPSYLLALLACLVYAWIHYRLIERPLYRLSLRWIMPRVAFPTTTDSARKAAQ
ncbi:acyltransferase [Vandammella animalimorsus]|uniref:acyltransferase family protein n=1 Tax=Vandammella animalimorsus TaxID=2029117 RepID=UPI0031BB989B